MERFHLPRTLARVGLQSKVLLRARPGPAGTPQPAGGPGSCLPTPATPATVPRLGPSCSLYAPKRRMRAAGGAQGRIDTVGEIYPHPRPRAVALCATFPLPNQSLSTHSATRPAAWRPPNPTAATRRATCVRAVAQRRVRLPLPHLSGSFCQAAGCSKPITPGKKVNRTSPVGPLRCLAMSKTFVHGVD